MTTSLPTVDFTVSDEQQALDEMMRSFFGGRRRPTGHEAVEVDAESWRQLGTELGVLGLGIDAEHHGPGGTAADAVVLYREAGRVLSEAPLIPLAVAGPLLAASNDPLLADVLSGDVLIGMAGLDLEASTISVIEEGALVRLEGSGRAILAGPDAAMLVVVGPTEAPRAVLVDSGAVGRSTSSVESIDLSRSWAIHDFRGTPGRLLASSPDEVSDAMDRARLAVAADQLGIASHMLDAAIDYVKVRYQFGRAIGSQQSIKHRCVDLSIAVERATSAVDYAALASPGLPSRIAALTALLSANDAAHTVTTGAIQLFGGIGMTWDHEAHLYLRRALANQAVFGSQARLRRSLSSLLWASRTTV
jgi:alkylation response protein AidB-like acyl-CoA dehydrogenase